MSQIDVCSLQSADSLNYNLFIVYGSGLSFTSLKVAASYSALLRQDTTNEETQCCFSVFKIIKFFKYGARKWWEVFSRSRNALIDINEKYAEA